MGTENRQPTSPAAEEGPGAEGPFEDIKLGQGQGEKDPGLCPKPGDSLPSSALVASLSSAYLQPSYAPGLRLQLPPGLLPSN